jgi:hypothetical protein
MVSHKYVQFLFLYQLKNNFSLIENIILSEVSQAQKTKNCMLSLICRL